MHKPHARRCCLEGTIGVSELSTKAAKQTDASKYIPTLLPQERRMTATERERVLMSDFGLESLINSSSKQFYG
ncbi:unnamed protein product [Anisakis simplex]|uniref:Uncharacterized protein n=1 Tax=Anisakis simplex TaxID=6269 RepID=A0A0M3JRR9_ANISI|nr:unnamed protein product [Anisakis simplex]